MWEKIRYFSNRLYNKIFEEEIFGNAAQVAFYFSFSLFPLLLFLISLFGIVLESADDFRRELFLYLHRIMPASAYELVYHTIEEVMEKSSGGKITIGLLIALWSSSAGLDSLRGALNQVYETKETRAIWKTKSLALFLTLVIGLLVFIALGIVFYGSQFLSAILKIISLPIPSPFFLGILQGITILIVLLSVFALIFNLSPNRKLFRWQWLTPGAITGIILWLLVSIGFRTYLQYFDSYSKTYGSLGAMIILMFWLYLTALTILISASINKVWDELADKKHLAEIKHIAADKQVDEDRQIPEQPKNSPLSVVPETTFSPKPEIKKAAETSASMSAANTIQGNSTDVLPTLENKMLPNAAINKADVLDEKLLPDSKPRRSEYHGKSLIGLTVAGTFGLLMGLMLKKKSDKS